MRTTVRLDDALLKEAKELAARSGRTLTRVIEDALRESMARQRSEGRRDRFEVVTRGGNGPLPGIDLDDSAALLDVMDTRGSD